MLDLKLELLQKIETKMVTVMNKEQLECLDRVLVSALDDYEIEKKCTEIILYDNNNDEALNFFHQLLILNGKSESTAKQYVDSTRKLLNAIGKPYKDITVFDLRKYFANMLLTVKDTTYNNYITYVNQFFKWLSDDGYINGNPMTKIVHIKEEKRIKNSFTDAERDSLRDSAQSMRDKALLEFLYSTGLRVGEVPAINISDINNDELIIYGQKSKKERLVYLSDSCKHYLELYLKERTDDNPALFVTHRSYNGEVKRLQADGIRRMMNGLGKKCNIDKVHPHRFRRTLGTNMVARGADIVTVKEILGHTNISTTQIYIDSSKINIKNKHKITA